MIEKGKEGGRVVVEVRVDAPMDAVWRALCRPEEIRRWFPLDARGEGVEGGTLEVTWGGDEWWPSRVEIPEDGRHLRLVSDMPTATGDTMTLAIDYTIVAEGGMAVVRLVHSGFGPGDEWDGYLEGLDAGWGYFMRNLKVYLERHRGAERTMAWARAQVSGSREEIWGALLDAVGVASAALATAAVGSPCEVHLSGRGHPAVLEATAPGRTLGVRLPEHSDAMLFLEVESEGESGRVGIWASMYEPDASTEAELRRAVHDAERALTAALPAPSP